MRSTEHCLLAALLVASFACNNQSGPDGGKPRHTIKEIMQTAKKKDLIKKAVMGTASTSEKTELTDLLVDLSKNQPPKGSLDSWNAKTTKLVSAARDVEAGKPGAGPAFRQAIDCDSCHNVHK